jgi:hypothetical protein
MFITREDLESELLYFRLKFRLHNRAAGQGVVWGLNAGLDGTQVCVLPGYAVDCCGNDLTVTTPYKVEARTLLCDPAIAKVVASGQSQCASLLLEYVECPEGPRPVHGDPCSTQTTRCEMSRIRETVRLRLVPTRGLDTSGPIADFLQDYEALSKDPQIGILLQQAAARVTTTSPAPTGPLPFGVHVVVPADLPLGGSGNDLLTQPLFDANASQQITVRSQETPVAATVALVAAKGFQFAPVGQVVLVGDPSGPVSRTPVPVTTSTAGDRAEWTVTLPFAQSAGAQNTFTYRLSGWQLTSPASRIPTTGGAVDIAVALAFQNADLNTLSLSTSRPAASSSSQTGFLPCFSDPYCGDQPRFAVFPPFLHVNPFNPSMPADPAVIALAILYAWFAIEVNRNQDQASVTLATPRLKLAASSYFAASRLLFDVSPNAGTSNLAGALKRLLAAWCKSLLYPGPQCEGDPHGVVIGCATIAGGAIQGIDPWGGRRWVVHYPLIEYWGRQFGIAPPDLIASKLFDLICCVARLTVPDPTQESRLGPPILVQPPETAQPVGRDSLNELGRSFVGVGPSGAVLARLAAAGVKPARTVTVSAAEFVTRTAAELVQIGQPPSANAAMVLYTVEGVPGLCLAVPDEGGATGTAGATGVASDPRRVAGLVRAALVARPAERAVPPLLREFAVSLAARVAGAIPLQSVPKADPATVDLLTKAGITTVGAVLSAAPDDLNEQVMNRSNPSALGTLLAGAEDLARSIAGVGGDLVVDRSRRGLVARSDLATGEARKSFADDLIRALVAAKVAVPPKVVQSAVDAAAGAGG